MGKLIDKFKNPKTKAGKYLLNLFIAKDQLWNARLGGDPDETVSSRIGKLEKKGIPKHRIFTRVLARMLNKVDDNHCVEAIEEDEGKDAIIDKV